VEERDVCVAKLVGREGCVCEGGKDKCVCERGRDVCVCV